MDNVFRLFRYLSNDKDRTDENNSYNVAYNALDRIVHLVDRLSRYGQEIHDRGGFMWSDADEVTKEIITEHRLALFDHAGQKQQAVRALVEEYFTSDEVGKLIAHLTTLKAQKVVQEEAEELGGLDDHPF